MSIRRCLCAVSVAIASVSVMGAVAAVPDDDVACVPSQEIRSMLTLRNHTDCPIYAYLDGKFAGRCEPFLKATIRKVGSGDLELIGRFRCDTWGPVKVHVKKGENATYTFTESNRRTRGVEPRPARNR